MRIRCDYTRGVGAGCWGLGARCWGLVLGAWCETKMATVTINRKGEDRVRAGHPWIYRSDVERVEAASGDLVQVTTGRGRPLGYALFSDRSEITLRMIAHGTASPASD